LYQFRRTNTTFGCNQDKVARLAVKQIEACPLDLDSKVRAQTNMVDRWIREKLGNFRTIERTQISQSFANY